MVGDKVSVYHLRDDILHLLKERYRIQFGISLVLNCVREKVKPQLKPTYIIFKKADGYDPLLDIYPLMILIQLTYFLVGIKHCVTVDGKWVLT